MIYFARYLVDSGVVTATGQMSDVNHLALQPLLDGEGIAPHGGAVTLETHYRDVDAGMWRRFRSIPAVANEVAGKLQITNIPSGCELEIIGGAGYFDAFPDAEMEFDFIEPGEYIVRISKSGHRLWEYKHAAG